MRRVFAYPIHTNPRVVHTASTMADVLYSIACIMVPALWGFAMFHAFGFVDRRRRAASKPTEREIPPIDYSI